MPAATPINKREEIIRRYEEGDTFAQIARELKLPYMTVHSVWRHYDKTGQIKPNYQACAKGKVRKDPAIYEQAVKLKGLHPRWGAGLIWVELADTFGEANLPSERTLQRWFHRGGVAPSRPQDEDKGPGVRRGRQTHEVWAMDAKEDMTLADGSKASWLLVSDEGSGAVLQTALFPCETVE